MNVYTLKKEDIFKRILNTDTEDEDNNFCNIEGDIKNDSNIKTNFINIPSEDTYSLPYATYMITPLSQMDGEDIVSRFDQCYGSWITRKKHRCNKGDPCKKIKQHFRINNPDYTGEHCRDDDGILMDGDTRMGNCNEECKPI